MDTPMDEEGGNQRHFSLICEMTNRAYIGLWRCDMEKLQKILCCMNRPNQFKRNNRNSTINFGANLPFFAHYTKLLAGIEPNHDIFVGVAFGTQYIQMVSEILAINFAGKQWCKTRKLL